jgi:hypothetical protein
VCVALLIGLLAACAPTPTPTQPGFSAEELALTATAVIAQATAQAAPLVTATHDTEQFPPLEQLALTAAPEAAAQAAQPAPTSALDDAALTATAIIAGATATAQASDAAQAVASPTAAVVCTPSAFSASLDALAAQARSALEDAGLELSAVTVTSAGIAGAGGDCAAMQPLYTTLAVALTIEDTDGSALAGVVEQALAALEAVVVPASLPGAHPPLLALTLSADDQPQQTLIAPYGAAREAYAAGLRGADLLAVMTFTSP